MARWHDGTFVRLPILKMLTFTPGTLATFPKKVYFSLFRFGTSKVILYFCRWNSKTMKLYKLLLI